MDKTPEIQDVDYESRYKKAAEFSKTKPTLAQALAFGRKPEVGFSNWVDEKSTEVQYGNSADAEGVLLAMIGESSFDRVMRQLKEIMGGDQISIVGVKEKDGHLVVKARSQYEIWSDETDGQGNAWRVTEIEFTEETLRDTSGRLQKKS